jgi:hypothetical protein
MRPMFSIACALLLAAAGLHAQQSGEIDIRFSVAEDQETFWEIWRETDDGPFVLALPYVVELTYTDRTRPGPDGRTEPTTLRLLADRALLWFEPESEDTDDATVENDPFLAMSRGVRNLQFYGENNVWLRYSVGRESVTLRCDRIFLDFARSRVVTYSGDGTATLTEGLNLTGRMDNVRAHSGADPDAPQGPGGLPLRTGIGFGEAAAEAQDPDSFEATGPAPSDDAIPEPAGRRRALPQELGLRAFIRAERLRILSLSEQEQEVQLEYGSISSSSLAVASYSLAAERLRIRLTRVRGTVFVTRPSVRVLDYPLLRLPVSEYSYDVDSQPPIRQLEFIRSDRFGYALRTYIDVVATYDLLADPEPPFNPFQAGPQIDYFSRRGLGLGGNLDWGNVRPFESFGRASVRSIYIDDAGDRRPRARELGWFPLETNHRGRFWGAHSQGFRSGWQIDSLAVYDSDRNFRREFYEPEYTYNEPINSFAQITRRHGSLNYFLRVEPKLHRWQSRTEYLPTLGFDAQRAEVGDFGLQMSTSTTASVMRFHPGRDDPRDTVQTLRLDSTTWFSRPVELGPFALDPFAGARFTAASRFLSIREEDGRPGLDEEGTFPGLREGDRETDGVLYRVMPVFGMNAQTFFTGTFPNARVPALGIDGLRHVIAPFVRYFNAPYNSLDDIPERAFLPLDSADVAGRFHEVRFGLRNRLQTRVGQGQNRRTSDYFEVMAEIAYYPDRIRDNNGREFSDLELTAVWRPIPGIALSGMTFLDLYTGNFERASASLRFDRVGIGRGALYYRLLKGQHQVIGAQIDLGLSELYRVGIKQEYDLQKGVFRDTRIELTRRVLEAFDVGFVFARDAVDGNIGIFLSLSAAFRSPRGGSALLR